MSIKFTTSRGHCTDKQLNLVLVCVFLFLQLFFTFDLIEYDFQKDEPIRNEQGWCSRVKKGKTLVFEEVSSGRVFAFLTLEWLFQCNLLGISVQVELFNY